MKHYYCVILVLAVFFAACGTAGPAVSGLVGLDAALDGAILDIEAKLPSGTPIVITVITAPNSGAREFIGDELSSRFKNLKTLAREAALSAAEREQDFQMSGIVSDESAVSIGNYIGAQAVISGEMKRFEDFTQLRLRTVNVETSESFVYSARIANNDRLLANILPRAETSGARRERTSTRAIDHLNRGNDFIAEKRLDDAIQEFDQAIAINSGLAEAYLGRGIAYRNKGDRDRALEEFNHAIRIRPNYAEAYKRRGSLFYFRGFFKKLEGLNGDSDIENAMADYNNAIRINSNDYEAYYMRSILYSLKDDDDRAMTDLNSALRINPNFAHAYYIRGLNYALNKDFDRAIADFTSVLRIDPNDTNSLYQRAEAYAEKRDFDRAIADYTGIIRIDPDYYLIKHVYYKRGEAYEEKGDFDRAIADFTSVLRIDPNDTISLFRRAEAYAEKGDFDRAIADFTSAIQIDPNRARAYSSRGSVYEKTGDINRAIADYETAVRLGSVSFQRDIDRLRQQQGNR